MPKPPVDPGILDKVNYVIDAWANPCEAPWYIYVETLWPALLEAFITLAAFGWDDVARGYWRPKGLGRRTRKKPGKGKPRRFRGFPEIGEEIGKRLPGADLVKGRKWSAGGKTLWRIDIAMQRLLFWWLVADVTADFAYNFTSVLYQTHWCKQAAKGRFSWHDDAWQIVGGTHWWVVNMLDRDYQIAPPFWGGDEGHTGPNQVTIMYAVSLRTLPPFAPTPTFETRLVEWPSRRVIAQSGVLIPEADGTIAVPIIARLKGPIDFRIQIRIFTTAAEYGNAVVVVTED